jgi:hypothetical protein
MTPEPPSPTLPNIQTFPQVIDDLYSMPIFTASAGSNFIFVVTTGDETVAWGAPVAGKFGIEGGGKNTSAPKYVTAVAGKKISSVSCGYGHVLLQVDMPFDAAKNAFPVYVPLPPPEPVSSKKRGGDGAKIVSKAKKSK